MYRRGNLLFTPDGGSILSPVGNRVSVFDLINNKSYTFAYEHRKNISRIALNPQATLLISVDEDGRAILTNFVRRTVIHYFNFKEKVTDIKFSPDGRTLRLPQADIFKFGERQIKMKGNNLRHLFDIEFLRTFCRCDKYYVVQ